MVIAFLLVPIVLFIFVQSGNGFQLFICQHKVKNRDVLPDMLRIAGAGDHTHAFLQISAENYLGYRFSMCRRNLLQDRIIQQ